MFLTTTKTTAVEWTKYAYLSPAPPSTLLHNPRSCDGPLTRRFTLTTLQNRVQRSSLCKRRQTLHYRTCPVASRSAWGRWWIVTPELGVVCTLCVTRVASARLVHHNGYKRSRVKQHLHKIASRVGGCVASTWLITSSETWIIHLYVIPHSVMKNSPDPNVFTVNANSGTSRNPQAKCWEPVNLYYCVLCKQIHFRRAEQKSYKSHSVSNRSK